MNIVKDYIKKNENSYSSFERVNLKSSKGINQSYSMDKNIINNLTKQLIELNFGRTIDSNDLNDNNEKENNKNNNENEIENNKKKAKRIFKLKISKKYNFIRNNNVINNNKSTSLINSSNNSILLPMLKSKSNSTKNINDKSKKSLSSNNSSYNLKKFSITNISFRNSNYFNKISSNDSKKNINNKTFHINNNNNSFNNIFYKFNNSFNFLFNKTTNNFESINEDLKRLKNKDEKTKKKIIKTKNKIDIFFENINEKSLRYLKEDIEEKKLKKEFQERKKIIKIPIKSLKNKLNDNEVLIVKNHADLINFCDDYYKMEEESFYKNYKNIFKKYPLIRKKINIFKVFENNLKPKREFILEENSQKMKNLIEILRRKVIKINKYEKKFLKENIKNNDIKKNKKNKEKKVNLNDNNI